ncbi:MAG: PAS domain-containing protein, partial [Bradyrhizobium sp.]|nr:PAS domain-containing protein [Bradyrhizobium sp.]
MTPPMPNPTGASSEALLEAMQAPPPAAGAPSFRMFLASVLAAAATVVAVELLTDLQKDRIVSLLMLAFGAVVVMIVLTSMLIRKSRHAIALANALARQNDQLAQTTRLLGDARRIGRLGHWVTDPSGEFAVWSDELFEIAGLEPVDQVAFATMLDIIHPEDVGAYVRARDRSRATGCAFIQELRFVTPNGQVRWVRIEANASDEADGVFRERF